MICPKCGGVRKGKDEAKFIYSYGYCKQCEYNRIIVKNAEKSQTIRYDY